MDFVLLPLPISGSHPMEVATTVLTNKNCYMGVLFVDIFWLCFEMSVVVCMREDLGFKEALDWDDCRNGNGGSC